MRYIDIFEKFKLPFSELKEDDILTHLIENIDRKEMEIEFERFSKSIESFPSVLIRTVFFDLFNIDNRISRYDMVGKKEFLYLKIKINHPNNRVRGNMDLNGYTISILRHRFKRIYDSYNVNIFLYISSIDMYDNPLSNNIIVIEEK